MSLNRRLLVCLGLFGMLWSVTGCKEFDVAEAVKKDNDSNIKIMVTCYQSFQGQNKDPKKRYVGPKDAADFREFLEGKAAQNFLGLIGADTSDMDALMTGRDGKPFKFRWSVQGSPTGSDEPVVFEDEGVDGQKMVGFTSHRFVEVSGQEYDDWFNGKYKPGSAGSVPTRGGAPPGR